MGTLVGGGKGAQLGDKGTAVDASVQPITTALEALPAPVQIHPPGTVRLVPAPPTTEAVDVAAEWTELGVAPPVGVDCWVDVYDGPLGKGFVVNYRAVADDGTVLEKRVNSGPEDWRESDWTEVAPIVP